MFDMGFEKGLLEVLQMIMPLMSKSDVYVDEDANSGFEAAITTAIKQIAKALSE